MIPWLSLRWRAGLWTLALLSALVVPVLVQVTGTHHGHWVGGGGGDWWREIVLPWSARFQAMVGVLTVAGWASFAAPPMPLRRQSVSVGLVAGLTGALVTLLAAGPPWLWLYRLGATAPGPLFSAMIWVGAAVLLSGLMAGGLGAFGLSALAALLGCASGGAIIWLAWA